MIEYHQRWFAISKPLAQRCTPTPGLQGRRYNYAHAATLEGPRGFGRLRPPQRRRAADAGECANHRGARTHCGPLPTRRPSPTCRNRVSSPCWPRCCLPEQRIELCPGRFATMGKLGVEETDIHHAPDAVRCQCACQREAGLYARSVRGRTAYSGKVGV